MKRLLTVAFLFLFTTLFPLPISPGMTDSLKRAGYVETLIEQRGALLEPSVQEKKQCFILYARDRNSEVYPYSQPLVNERLDTLKLRATPGETESRGFCVYSLNALKDVVVSNTLTASGKNDAWLSTTCKVEDVVFYPIRSMVKNDTGRKYILYPVFLDKPLVRAVTTGRTLLFWLTVKIPEAQAAGTYRGAIALTIDNKKFSLPVTVEVLPFKLTKSGIPAFGAFLSRDPFASEEHAFLKECGIDALQWFWSAHRIKVINDSGKMKLDFSAADSFISAMQKAGMTGPVVIGLGNEKRGGYENAIHDAFKVPLIEKELNGAVISVADTTDARFNELYVQGVKMIWQHATEKKWPPLSLIIYDEAMKRLMPWQRHWYRLVKATVPDVPIYGVFQIADADKMEQIPFCDIVVCNRGFANSKKLAAENGKKFWTYQNCDANRSFGKVRFLYGQVPSYYGSGAMFFWSYNYFIENPWNDFDNEQGDADWNLVYPSLDGKRPIETVALKGLVAGINDVRYIKTLEQILSVKNPEKWKRVSSHIDAMQNKMFEGVVLDDRIFSDVDFFRVTRNNDTEKLRDFVINEIMEAVK